MKGIFRYIILFSLLFFLKFDLRGETNFLNPEGWIPPEKEAPPALFLTNIGDTDVNFFANGSWDTRLAFVTGLLLRPGFPITWLDSFPGESVGFLYENNPDLTLSVRLKKKYFLELSVLKDFNKNSFLMGYEGSDGEPLKHLYIGNRDISVPSSPFIDVPESGNSSIGISALLSSGDGAIHNLMLRYDLAETEEKKFLGKNEIEEKVIDVGDYVRGRYFYLPDREVSNFQLFVRDPKGNLLGSDSYRYRTLEPSEYIFNNSTGEVYLKNDPGERLVVYYTKDGVSIGDNSLGKDALPGFSGSVYDFTLPPVNFNWQVTYMGINMNDLSLIIGDKKGLILWDNGKFSPFLMCNNYKVGDTLPSNMANLDIKLYEKGNVSPSSFSKNFDFLVYADRGTIRVLPYDKDELKSSELFKKYYPFVDLCPFIYGVQSVIQKDVSKYSLKVRVLTPVSEYSLGEAIIPGSVHVMINGVEETRFEVNYDTGRLTFPFSIKPTDYIEVTYKTESVTARGGDIVSVWGDKIKLSDPLQLRLGGALRWNLFPGSYTIEEDSKTGAIIGSVGLDYKTKFLSSSATVAIGYSNPDTTGTLRVAGMEDKGNEVNISEDNIFPSSVPDSILFASEGINDITRETRGKLFYKNYRNYGPFGSVSLVYYGDAIPQSNVYDYKTGSKCGPYIAGGSSLGRSGESLVLDYSIPSDKRWVGAQIPLSREGNEDCSSVDSISISFKGDKIAGKVRIYVQIGEIGEDLDGDGILDRENNSFSAGFDFNDTSNGAVLHVGGGPLGTGNSIEDSEDFNSNGFLDSENPDYIVSFTSSVSNDLLCLWDTTGWRHYTYFLTDAERKKLVSTRSVRIIVVREDGGNVSGRILIDRITLNGSSFIPGSSSGDVYTEEVPEAYLPMNCFSKSKSLRELFPELSGIINEDTRRQMTLGIKWDSVSSAEGFSVKHYLAKSIRYVNYDELVFYTGYCGDETEGTLSLSLVDSTGKGIRVSLGVSEISSDNGQGWHRVSVELEKKLVFVDGIPSNGGRVSIDRDFSSLSELRIGVRGLPSGFIFMDEVLLRRSRGRLGMGFKGSLDYRVDGPIYTLWGNNLLSDFEIKVRTYLGTPGFSSLYGVPLSHYTYFSSVHNSFKIFGSNVGVDFMINGEDNDIYFTLGHSLNIPLYGVPITLSDGFSERFGGTDEFSKSNGIDLNFWKGNGISLNFGSDYANGTISREWSGNGNLVLGNILNSGRISFSRSEQGYIYNFTDYFTDWGKTFEFLNPKALASQVDRETKIKNNGNIVLPISRDVSVGLKTGISGDVHAFNFREIYQDLGSKYQFSLSFPIKIGRERGVSIEPLYERNLSVVDTTEYTDSFFGDLNNFWRFLGDNSYFYGMIPFVELYDSSLLFDIERASRLFDRVDYTPSVSLILSRNYGSYLIDLFLPSSVTFEFDRKICGEYSVVSESFESSVKLQSTAMNLFGRLGAYGFFDFYKTDEFVSSLYLELKTDERGIMNDYSLNIIHYLDLVGDNREYSFHNSLNLRGNLDSKLPENIKDTVDIGFKWIIGEPPSIFRLLIPFEWAEGSFLENEEKLRYIYSSRDSGETFLPVNIIFEHWTKLKIENRGFVGINVGTGFSMENENGEGEWGSLYRIFFKVGLRAKISF